MTWTPKAPFVSTEAIDRTSLDDDWHNNVYDAGFNPCDGIEVMDRTSIDDSWREELLYTDIVDHVEYDLLDRTSIDDSWRDDALVTQSDILSPLLAVPVNTDPYLDSARLDPQPSETGVDQATTILIPACDREPLTEIRANIANDSGIADTTGLRDSYSVIRVDSGSGFVVVYKNGSAQNGWVVSKPANAAYGFDYTLIPPALLPADTLITVEVTVFDYTNTFISCTEYSFETGSSPPQIIPIYPVDDDSGIPKNSPIIFKAIDLSGINLAATIIWIDGSIVYQNSSAVTSVWAVAVSALTGAEIGYRFELTPLTRSVYYRDEVSVSAYVENISASSARAVWTFGSSPNIGFKIYPMILASIRKKDEES